MGEKRKRKGGLDVLIDTVAKAYDDPTMRLIVAVLIEEEIRDKIASTKTVSSATTTVREVRPAKVKRGR